MKSERFTPTGWEVESENKARGNSAPANGIVEVHDRAAQKYLPRAIESLELKWQNYSGEWTLRLTKKTPELFVAWLQSLPPDIEVLLDKELATLRDAPVSGNVLLDVAEAGIDWFDLKVALQVNDTTLTPQELNLLLNARGGYVRLGKRGWRRLQFSLTPEDDEQLARLGLDARDFSAERQRFHALQLADDAAKKFLAPERVEEIQRRASELKTRVAPPLPPAARALKADHRLALTGTPIENRLLDLWSIFGFAMPGALGSRAHFLRRFDAKDDPLARRRLAARVRPFLLRRTKAQVERDLPDRVEEDLRWQMEGEQKTLYRAGL